MAWALELLFIVELSGVLSLLHYLHLAVGILVEVGATTATWKRHVLAGDVTRHLLVFKFQILLLFELHSIKL